jgi:hypothetical protein
MMKKLLTLKDATYEFVGFVTTAMGLFLLTEEMVLGFWVGGFSNLVWMMFAYRKEAWWLMSLNFLLVLINIKGIIW